MAVLAGGDGGTHMAVLDGMVVLPNSTLLSQTQLSSGECITTLKRYSQFAWLHEEAALYLKQTGPSVAAAIRLA
jgi:hypothetical protein